MVSPERVWIKPFGSPLHCLCVSRWRHLTRLKQQKLPTHLHQLLPLVTRSLQMHHLHQAQAQAQALLPLLPLVVMLVAPRMRLLPTTHHLASLASESSASSLWSCSVCLRSCST